MSEKTPLHDPLADAFDSFRGDALPTFVPPGPDAVRTTVRRRRRNRTIATAACAMVLIAGAGAALANFKPPADDLRPEPADSVTASPSLSPSISKSPSPSPSPSAAANVRTIDWRNHAFQIDRSDGCTGGMVTFRDGKATHDGHTYLADEAAPVYGDIDGDGHEDALLSLKCGTAQELGRMLAGVNAGGESLGVITGEHYLVAFSKIRVSGGTVTVDATDRSQDPDVTHVRSYRWDGTALTQVSGPTSFEERTGTGTFDWSTATLTIPFKAAQTTIQPNNRSCPRVTVTFARVSDGQGAVQAGGCEYWVQRVASADLDNDGSQDALVRISAIRTGTGDLSEGAAWYFGYAVRDGKPVLIGFVTAANLDSHDDDEPTAVKATSASASKGSVRVTQVFRGQTVTRTFTWNGSRFAPDKAPPDQTADGRP